MLRCLNNSFHYLHTITKQSLNYLYSKWGEVEVPSAKVHWKFTHVHVLFDAGGWWNGNYVLSDLDTLVFFAWFVYLSCTPS